jgi:hypothetical protein
VAQLEDVAEEHQTLTGTKHVEQRAARGLVAQDIIPRRCAEVQI